MLPVVLGACQAGCDTQAGRAKAGNATQHNALPMCYSVRQPWRLGSLGVRSRGGGAQAAKTRTFYGIAEPVAQLLAASMAGFDVLHARLQQTEGSALESHVEHGPGAWLGP